MRSRQSVDDTREIIPFFGEATEWEGILRCRGTVFIDGRLSGEILSEGNIVIGESAVIEANIRAGYIVNRGLIQGDIVSNDRVDIQKPGRVSGNIEAPVVVVDREVNLEETTLIKRDKLKGERKSDVVPIDEYDAGPPANVTAVYGIVTNRNTGFPIKHADVLLFRSEEERVIRSNRKGYFEMINLPEGKWTLRIEATGYQTKESLISVSSGSSAAQNVSLKYRTLRHPKDFIRKYLRKPGYHGSPY